MDIHKKLQLMYRFMMNDTFCYNFVYKSIWAESP
uniref:Uncharacterized protein n=1 Tax=Lepeophtheirus salmonis TaxID=72036 RepID=A0A0K2TJ04_LEPSM